MLISENCVKSTLQLQLVFDENVRLFFLCSYSHRRTSFNHFDAMAMIPQFLEYGLSREKLLFSCGELTGLEEKKNRLWIMFSTCRIYFFFNVPQATTKQKAIVNKLLVTILLGCAVFRV